MGRAVNDVKLAGSIAAGIRYNVLSFFVDVLTAKLISTFGILGSNLKASQISQALLLLSTLVSLQTMHGGSSDASMRRFQHQIILT
jgi:hypothetical protein